MADSIQNEKSGTPSASSLRENDNAAHNREMFNAVLYPDDMYNKDNVYYGDMGWKERASFVMAVNAEEARKERGQTWVMFKRNPLSPVAWYFKNCVLPGAGLGLEG